jgi:hypothetical protein
MGLVPSGDFSVSNYAHLQAAFEQLRQGWDDVSREGNVLRGSAANEGDARCTSSAFSLRA